MGVELTLYRSRIGAFAACHKPHRPRVHYSGYNPESKYEFWTDLSVRMIVCTLFLYALIGYGYFGKCLLSSNCALSVSAAILGEHISDFISVNVPRCTSVYYTTDLSAMLLLGGDVESNPGPIEMVDLNEALASALADFGKDITEKFQAMLTGEIQKVRNDIGKMNQKLMDMENEIALIRSKIDYQEECVDRVKDAQDSLRTWVKEIDGRQEQQEIRDRRDNVLLYGVPEPVGEDGVHENCEEKFVQVVNSVLSCPIRVTDVTRAHRVGKRAAGKARPLIARVHRSTDKMNILGRRRELRERNIGVSGDLTVRQREELRQARDDGFFAYYKGGVLHREERRQSPRHDRPVTRSYARVTSGASVNG